MAVAKKRDETMSFGDCRSGDAGEASTETCTVDPSDLLVRLRDAAFDADDMLIANVKALFREAADEIESLRARVGAGPGDRT